MGKPYQFWPVDIKKNLGPAIKFELCTPVLKYKLVRWLNNDEIALQYVMIFTGGRNLDNLLSHLLKRKILKKNVRLEK